MVVRPIPYEVLRANKNDLTTVVTCYPVTSVAGAPFISFLYMLACDLGRVDVGINVLRCRADILGTIVDKKKCSIYTDQHEK